MEIDFKRMRKKKHIQAKSDQYKADDGNEDLLAFMYRMYVDKLYAYGLSFHSDVSLVEDAIHDVFIDVYTNQKRLAHISNLEQYVKTAFRHRLLFLLQGNKRYMQSLNEISDLLTEKNSQELWIESEEEKDKKRLVKNLLSDLTQHQREAVHLRFIEGLSYDEISEIMEIKYDSVKMLIKRSIYSIRNKNNAFSSNADSYDK